MGIYIGIVGENSKKFMDIFNRYFFENLGFILLILPFSFAYLMELQKEAAKVMGGTCFVMQPKIQECIDDVCVIKHDFYLENNQ